MPNVQQVLNDEIRRLAKKEVKSASEQITALRKYVNELERRIKTLEKLVPVPEVPEKTEEQPEENPEERKVVRVTKERITKWRENLGVSQTQFAKLLGVSHLSVSHWESGKTQPREAQKQRIATLRDMSKRELKKLMTAKLAKPAPTTAGDEATAADSSDN